MTYEDMVILMCVVPFIITAIVVAQMGRRSNRVEMIDQPEGSFENLFERKDDPKKDSESNV